MLCIRVFLSLFLFLCICFFHTARLRYGDSISLVPNELNAVVSGTRYGQAWVQTLVSDAGVPPNLRECQWRLLPPRQFVEQKKLAKFLKEGEWNEGRQQGPNKVPLPRSSFMYLFVCMYAVCVYWCVCMCLCVCLCDCVHLYVCVGVCI